MPFAGHPVWLASVLTVPHRTNTQYKFLRPDTDAEVLAKYGWAPWSCVCKEADCQRKAGWKAPAKTPGRQGKRPASDEDGLPDEPPRAQGFPVHKIEKSPRPAIFNEIYEIWASRCASLAPVRCLAPLHIMCACPAPVQVGRLGILHGPR